jgi:large subunit ribosomal protein L3
LWEFRVAEDELEGLAPGDSVNVDRFQAGQVVDVTAQSKGKGFQGVVKRHNFRTQDATHGNSLAHRAPGSIGQNQSPGRVFKGKKMSGHMGAERKTIQNLKVVRVDSERSLVLVQGAVPGAPSSDVMIRPAVKAKG